MNKHAPLLIALLMAGTALTACTHHQDQSSTIAQNEAPQTDSDMQKVLDAQASLLPKPIEGLTPAQARLQPTPTDGVKKVLLAEGKNPNDPMGVKTKDIMVSGGAGSIPARVYMPAKFDGKKPLPVVVYYHGGGFVIADVNVYDGGPRSIAKMAHAIVISVEYRKAPEHHFPAQQEDAFAAYKWVLKNAASLGGDPRNVAVMGESAGGNLAINTAIMARNAKIQLPVHEVLVYPVAGTNMNTPSYNEQANAKPLNKAMMGWFVKYTIRSDKDKTDPRLDLIGHADLHGLPPTTIINAELDPLKSDGDLLAQKLEQSGVKVNHKVYNGVTHEFFGMGAVVSDAKSAEGVAASDLKSSFKKKI
jgi:acetyl esterase